MALTSHQSMTYEYLQNQLINAIEKDVPKFESAFYVQTQEDILMPEVGEINSAYSFCGKCAQEVLEFCLEADEETYSEILDMHLADQFCHKCGCALDFIPRSSWIEVELEHYSIANVPVEPTSEDLHTLQVVIEALYDTTKSDATDNVPLLVEMMQMSQDYLKVYTDNRTS